MEGSPTVSILQGKDKYCYIRGTRDIFLHRHHIYHGSGRKKISDKHGFWVWLSPDLHNLSENGVHGKNGQALNLQLKQDCQRKFEETHTREEFMKIIKRNCLD